MATVAPVAYETRIGEAAGTVWKTLAVLGPMSQTRLVKEVGEPRDLVMQGLGWLAREDKIVVDEEGRTRIVSLR